MAQSQYRAKYSVLVAKYSKETSIEKRKQLRAKIEALKLDFLKNNKWLPFLL